MATKCCSWPFWLNCFREAADGSGVQFRFLYGACICIEASDSLFRVMDGYVGDLSDLVRWTVDGDPSGLPCKQCWFRPDMPLGRGRVMWDVRYLFVHLQSVSHAKHRHTRDWTKHFSDLLDRNGLGAQYDFGGENRPVQFWPHLTTTLGLYYFYNASAEISRKGCTVGLQAEVNPVFPRVPL